jgi:hypothetical protein
MRTPIDVYCRFAEFEERAAGLYLTLASRFSPQNPELSEFWVDMAMQEKQHAGLLQFCVAEQLFAPDVPGEADIKQFADFFTGLESRAADPALDMNKAFDLAAELEGSELNAVFSYLTTSMHKSLYLMRKKIAASQFDHVECLIDAGVRFGVAGTTLDKLQNLKQSAAERTA